jgi:hypothetical protein
LEAPANRAPGETDVTAGLTLTVRAAALVAVPPSVLVTVSERSPVAAVPLMLTTTVNCVAESRVTVSMVMPLPESVTVSWVAEPRVTSSTVMPVPENDTSAPSWKTEPVTVRVAAFRRLSPTILSRRDTSALSRRHTSALTRLANTSRRASRETVARCGYLDE